MATATATTATSSTDPPVSGGVGGFEQTVAEVRQHRRDELADGQPTAVAASASMVSASRVIATMSGVPPTL